MKTLEVGDRVRIDFLPPSAAEAEVVAIYEAWAWVIRHCVLESSEPTVWRPETVALSSLTYAGK